MQIKTKYQKYVKVLINYSSMFIIKICIKNKKIGMFCQVVTLYYLEIETASF